VASRFEKHPVSRLLYPPDSTDLNPYDFYLFEMLKGVLKDHQFQSSDEIEKAITKVWGELSFDEGQSVFHN
jgi:hypothetical protein